MISGQRVLAIIPARGGSKGIPRKNVRVIHGKPLIAWTIEAAKSSKYIDRLILSSDDKEIMETALAWGCEVPFVRPAELAQDMTPGIDPVLHAIDAIGEHFEYVVLLQPTSPLRAVEDIDACVAKCADHGGAPCVSVVEAEQSPYWMYHLDDDAKMYPILVHEGQFVRRQQLPAAYMLNGAVYVASSEWLKSNRTFLHEETTAHVMPRARSVDIDEPLDFVYAEALLRYSFET